MLIGLILGSEHPWRTETAALGTVAWDGDAQGLDGAARAPLDLLLLDAADLDPADIPAIRSYRIARPSTRILASLPADAQPGHPVAAGLVALGIYDLAQGLSLAEALSREASYADAVRWHVEPQAPPRGRGLLRAPAGPQPEVQVRERVVERRVAVSSRPVEIRVGGVGAGVGTTTLACAIGHYLARQGHRTVLVEVGEPSLAVLADRNDPGRWTGELDVYPRQPGAEATSPRELVRARSHAYVVADVGILTDEHLQSDADLVVLVIPGDPHRYLRAEAWRQAHRDLPEGLRVAVVGGSNSRQVADTWRELAGIEPVVVPIAPAHSWPPGGGKGEQVLDQALAALLGDLVPEGRPRKRWPF